jgi:hypothetical protein
MIDKIDIQSAVTSIATSYKSVLLRSASDTLETQLTYPAYRLQPSIKITFKILTSNIDRATMGFQKFLLEKDTEERFT